MDVGDLVADYTVNEQLLHAIRDRIDDLRFVLNFDIVPVLLDKESIGKTLEYLLRNSPQTGTALYTGSKATDYFNTHRNVPMSEQCLFSILNQRPELIRIARLCLTDGRLTIAMANSIHE
jgi:hypothetical protein